MKKSKIAKLGLFILIAVVVSSCGPGEVGPQGETGPQGAAGAPGAAMGVDDLSCLDCHNDTTMLTGVQTAWSASLHGTGEAYDYAGGRAGCAGCHSGGAFSEMIAAGQNPEEYEAGDANPTRQECRTCHEIHTTYTVDDFALETTAAVEMFAFEGQIFDGGKGNLCVNCHQPRRGMDAAVDGMVEITSTHWGPHHGPQSAMLLGLAGGGEVTGSPSKHATQVEDTCVGCHMGAGDNHTFEPNVAACTECHDDAESFDINGVQTEVQGKLDELEVALLAKGWLDEEGHPAVTSIPEGEAAALWNWIYIAHEDKSLGVHNPSYTIDLLDASLESLQ